LWHRSAVVLCPAVDRAALALMMLSLLPLTVSAEDETAQ
jgi:hypothetical protein